MGNRYRQRGAGARGTTLIEVLVAALILAIGVMGMVRLWFFAFRISVSTDDRAVAYNLGRRAMEGVKRAGFFNAAEGTATTYYDGQETPVAQASSRYVVQAAVTSSVAWPNDWATRSVVVSVKLRSTNEVLYSTSTVLVRAGV